MITVSSTKVILAIRFKKERKDNYASKAENEMVGREPTGAAAASESGSPPEWQETGP